MPSPAAPADSGSRPRLLIFVPAYEAAEHIEAVIERIPRELADEFDTHLPVSDDASSDETAKVARHALEGGDLPYEWTILVSADNRGYGGNQKLGYRYAVDNGFDVVVMVHGDGQYPPEEIRPLARLALSHGAAFGSRMAVPGAARTGGMPLYKRVGNRILTILQNKILGTDLSEFHSGFRAYSASTLRAVPFELNSDDFHFDTEIFIQAVRSGVRIAEMPIATHYGDEICRVDGLSYAGNVVSQTLRASLRDKGLFYERKYDIGSTEGHYQSKLGFTSPAQEALARIPAGCTVLDLGVADGHLARALRDRGCRVIGVDRRRPTGAEGFDHFVEWDLDDGLPSIGERVDVIVLADVIEHLRSPEDFVERLAAFSREHDTASLLVSTGNVAFLAQRIMLLLGQFNYGPRGILDMTHTRLFTERTIRRLFRQAGFRVDATVGIPAPFPLAVRHRTLGQALLAVNTMAIRLSAAAFSYQIFLALTPPVDIRDVITRSQVHASRETVPVQEQR